MASEKRIHRAKHDTENPYYIAARSTAQDKTVSYDALGMLHYVLSKPDDWIIQPSDLEREKCKRSKVYAILKELIKAKYVERIYHRDDKKRVTLVEYVAHELPIAEKLLVEKLEVEKQDIEKQHITEYREEHSTESTVAPKVAVEKKDTIPASQMNPMKDSIAAAFEWAKPTAKEWGKIQVSAKELIQAEVKPEEVKSLYSHCKAKLTDFGPTALPNHVSEWRKVTTPVRQDKRVFQDDSAAAALKGVNLL